MISFFNDNITIIVFLHVLSAVIWVGGMISIRFIVHYAIGQMQDQSIKLSIILTVLNRFFKVVWILLVILIVTAVLMIIGFGFKGTDLASISHIKEGIYTLMVFIFIIAVLKRRKAQVLFNQNDLEKCKNNLLLISTYLIPLNIILGIVSIYLGITLRGL